MPQADASSALDDKTEHFRVHQQIDGHALEIAEIGRRRIVANPPLDTELVPANACRDLPSNIGRHRKPKVLRRLDEGGSHMIAIRDVAERQDLARITATPPCAVTTRQRLA